MDIKQQQKTEAIRRLAALNIYSPFVNYFIKNDVPCFFERCVGYWATEEPKLWAKVQEYQKATGNLVYAITHEYLEGDELWSFLIVSTYPECWKDELDRYGICDSYAFAYTWNVDHEYFSEAGDIAVRSAIGGIRRI